MPVPSSIRSCLHLIVSAQSSALNDCLDQRREADTVMFIDAGVMHLVDGQGDRRYLADSGFFFSGEDLEARGLTPFARQQGVHILDDRATVRLLRDHDHCLTWK